jgi:hypothetical protein
MGLLPMFGWIRRWLPWGWGGEEIPPPPRGVDRALWVTLCTQSYTYRLCCNIGIIVGRGVGLITLVIPGFGEGFMVGLRQEAALWAVVDDGAERGSDGRCTCGSEDWSSPTSEGESAAVS